MHTSKLIYNKSQYHLRMVIKLVTLQNKQRKEHIFLTPRMEEILPASRAFGELKPHLHGRKFLARLG